MAHSEYAMTPNLGKIEENGRWANIKKGVLRKTALTAADDDFWDLRSSRVMSLTTRTAEKKGHGRVTSGAAAGK